jgi:hypothetical protein
VDGGFGFLRVRNAIDALCSVYGRVFPTTDVPLSEVSRVPVAFTVHCELGLKGSGFVRVGNEPLPDALREPVWFWRRIVGDADHVTLDSSSGESRTVPIAEAEGLERDGGYGREELAKRLVAWLEGRDPVPEENRKRLREKPWMGRSP